MSSTFDIRIEGTLIFFLLIHVAFLLRLLQRYYLTIALVLLSQRVNE